MTIPLREQIEACKKADAELVAYYSDFSHPVCVALRAAAETLRGLEQANRANVGCNEGACPPSEVRREEISGSLEVGCAHGGDVTRRRDGDPNGLVAEIDDYILRIGPIANPPLRILLQRARDEIAGTNAAYEVAVHGKAEAIERIAALEAELAEAIEERDERNAACSAFCDDRNKAREALRKLADYVERLHMHAIPEGHRCTELLDAYDVLGVTK